MLFKRRFHAGIRDGSVTLTFRAWKAAKARPRSVHRLGPQDAIEIESVRELERAKITRADAARAGFADRDELLALLGAPREGVPRAVPPRADRGPARRADASAGAVDEVLARLERMDRLSRRAPWTRRVLELIDAHPRTAASKLAPRLKRETRAFKADVRKLKELGLTESHEVGYTLSRRGRNVLSRLRD